VEEAAAVGGAGGDDGDVAAAEGVPAAVEAEAGALDLWPVATEAVFAEEGLDVAGKIDGLGGGGEGEER